MKVFFYCNGEEIKIGDRILMTDVNELGTVAQIVQPFTDEAAGHNAFELGGVMFETASGDFYFWSVIDEHLEKMENESSC